MASVHHPPILNQLISHSGRATRHTDQDNYHGTTSPRYAISVPVLRTIAWMKEHADLN